MTTPASGRYDVPGYIAALGREGDLLATAARSRGTGPADCDVTGLAREVYLTLWNRRPPDGLQVTGDPGILAAFSRALQITW